MDTIFSDIIERGAPIKKMAGHVVAYSLEPFPHTWLSNRETLWLHTLGKQKLSISSLGYRDDVIDLGTERRPFTEEEIEELYNLDWNQRYDINIREYHVFNTSFVIHIYRDSKSLMDICPHNAQLIRRPEQGEHIERNYWRHVTN